MTTYNLTSVKHSEPYEGDLLGALARAAALAEEYQPAFGVAVDRDESTVATVGGNDSYAQVIATLLGDDGQSFGREVDGGYVTLADLAATLRGEQAWRDGWRTGDTYRWNFRDGSAIVVAGDAWDFPLDSNLDCYCWEGGGEHVAGCAVAEHGRERRRLKELAFRVGDDAIRELCTLTDRDEAGRHFTEWARHLDALEAAGLIEIERPVHEPTGLPYDHQHWSVTVTEDGIAVAEAWGPDERELVDDTSGATNCGCGEWTGRPCQWVGLASEMVVVEYMPESLRESHRAAGGSGSYPHNGAVRVAVSRDCAEAVVEHSRDEQWEWAQIREDLSPDAYVR